MMSKNSKLSSWEKYSHMIHENVETGEITFDKVCLRKLLMAINVGQNKQIVHMKNGLKSVEKNVLVNMRMMKS